jgi:putative transposase
MSIFIHKSHNVSVLIYHLVCPAKYRKAIFTKDVDDALEDICEEISQRYEIIFLEIGTDREHVHFLIQSVPMYSPKKIAQIVKSITAREIFKRCPLVKKALWGGEFWTDGYFITSVGKDGNESIIKNYVKNQGDDSYVKVHREKTKDEQFNLW